LRLLLLFIVFICGCRFYSLSLFVVAAFIRFLYLWLPLFFYHLYLQSFVVLHFTKLISAR